METTNSSSQNPLQTKTHTSTLSPFQIGPKSPPSTLFAGMMTPVWFLCIPSLTLSPSLALQITVLFLLTAKHALFHSLLSFRSSFLLPLSVILHVFHFAMTVSYHRGAVCHGLASLLRRGRFAPVCVVVEVGEEDDEGDGVANQSPLHPGGEWTACVEGVSSMADGYVELNLLNTPK